MTNEELAAEIEQRCRRYPEDKHLFGYSPDMGQFVFDNRDAILSALRVQRQGGASGWLGMDSAPRDGTPILVFRRIHGWSVFGWARWFDVRGVSGWIAYGFFDPPGELGLAEPDFWQPLQLPEPPSGPRP